MLYFSAQLNVSKFWMGLSAIFNVYFDDYYLFPLVFQPYLRRKNFPFPSRPKKFTANLQIPLKNKVWIEVGW